MPSSSHWRKAFAQFLTRSSARPRASSCLREVDNREVEGLLALPFLGPVVMKRRKMHVANKTCTTPDAIGQQRLTKLHVLSRYVVPQDLLEEFDIRCQPVRIKERTYFLQRLLMSSTGVNCINAIAASGKNA